MYSYIHLDCPACDGEKVLQVECEQPSYDSPGGCDVGICDVGYEGTCACVLTQEQVDRLEEMAIEVYCEPYEPY